MGLATYSKSWVVAFCLAVALKLSSGQQMPPKVKLPLHGIGRLDMQVFVAHFLRETIVVAGLQFSL
jgi:hypothetical protein